MPIETVLFGSTTQGKDVYKYKLSNGLGVVVHVINLGGAITSIRVKDKDGYQDDIVLGYDTVAEYEKNGPSFGVIVGRFANRIANGQFSLDGENFQLEVNNGPNHLHGGSDSFSKKVWDPRVEGNTLYLTYVSANGENNYPGEVTCIVSYELTDDSQLIIKYSATSTKATPLNLTNHSYFNLAGHQSPNVYEHDIQVLCDEYTPKDSTSIPTGEIESVSGTVFDLREYTSFSERIETPAENSALYPAGDRPGYDHNYCTGATMGENKLVARVRHVDSGRVMECSTDQPGLQLYTANWLEKEPGKAGHVYNQHAAFCLETQNYPDAPNKANFPNCIVRPGETFTSTTIYKFTTEYSNYYIFS